MILSSQSIRSRLTKAQDEGGIVLEPYAEESQQPASYDLRASEPILLRRQIMTLLASKEWIELPTDIAATLRCRSSFARRGVFLSGGFVDPGFRGHLTLCLINFGPEEIVIREGERIVQIIFQEMDNADHGYSGQYQDSYGVVTAR